MTIHDDGSEDHPMIRVAVLGASGYTGAELIKLLLRHPDVDITALTTRQESEPHLDDVHPTLAGRLDRRLEKLDPEGVAARADCVFSCLPHASSAEFVKDVIGLGARVIDFSADYRLDDPDIYAQWYASEHPDPERMAETVYGLPELFREQIRHAPLVANPGCYPTSAILALAPLLESQLIDGDNIIIDSKSGVSGAGRTPKANLHFPECNEGVVAYGVGRHRHMPEIDQVLSTVAHRRVETVFTPHLIPMDRGIFTTAYARPAGAYEESVLLDRLRDFYAEEPFIRVVDHPPSTKAVAHTNFCDVTAHLVRGHVVAMSAIDNLVKGASGAAVQNFNLMYGLPEQLALL